MKYNCIRTKQIGQLTMKELASMVVEIQTMLTSYHPGFAGVYRILRPPNSYKLKMSKTTFEELLTEKYSETNGVVTITIGGLHDNWYMLIQNDIPKINFLGGFELSWANSSIYLNEHQILEVFYQFYKITKPKVMFYEPAELEDEVDFFEFVNKFGQLSYYSNESEMKSVISKYHLHKKCYRDMHYYDRQE